MSTNLPELSLAGAVFLCQTGELCLQLMGFHLQFLPLAVTVLHIRCLLFVRIRPSAAD